MSKNNPIAEVFGFPISNETETAKYYRENRLCPFHNRFPNCTKDKANNPLGVCSVNHGENKVITCPSRFREDWKILHDAASFVWPNGTKWTSLPEIKLVDANGQSAGNVDYVIVSYDEDGQITDFASIEVLTSSQKDAISQMLFIGGVFKAWNKKHYVAIQKPLFDEMPKMAPAKKDDADIVWLLYDLKYDEANECNHMALVDTAYTEFQIALDSLIETKSKIDFDTFWEKMKGYSIGLNEMKPYETIDDFLISNYN